MNSHLRIVVESTKLPVESRPNTSHLMQKSVSHSKQHHSNSPSHKLYKSSRRNSITEQRSPYINEHLAKQTNNLMNQQNVLDYMHPIDVSSFNSDLDSQRMVTTKSLGAARSQKTLINTIQDTENLAQTVFQFSPIT